MPYLHYHDDMLYFYLAVLYGCMHCHTSVIQSFIYGLIADQTPTPTRFIRNCEEVGLFQDLQNCNPFEEQFRKATEANKSGTTPLHGEVIDR